MSQLLDQVKKAMPSMTDNGKGASHATTSDQSGAGRRRRGTRSRKHHKKSAKKHHKKSAKKHHKKSAKKHHKKSGKKHHKKSGKKHRARRGGSMVSTAALPFGLLAIQKFFQTRKGRKDLKRMNKSVRKTARRTSRRIRRAI